MSVRSANLGAHINLINLGGTSYANDAAALAAWQALAARTPGVNQAGDPGAGVMYYNSTTSRLRLADGAGAWNEYVPGGPAGVTMDDSYSLGHAVTVDDGEITYNDATAGAAHTLAINKSGAGSGNLVDVDISAAHTGNVFDVEYTGAATGNVLDVLFTNAGAGAQAVVIGTGTTAMSTAGWALDIDVDAAASAAAISIVSSAAATGAFVHIDGTSATGATFLDFDTPASTVPVIDIDCAGTGSGHVVDIAFAAAWTGNALEVDMTNAVAAAALNVTLAGARTDSAVEITDASTSNVAAYLHTVNGVRTGACMSFDVDADMTADVMTFLLASQTTGNGAISISEEAGALAGHCIQITKNSTGASVGLDLNWSGAGSGDLIDIDISAAATGRAISIVTSAAFNNDAIFVDLESSNVLAQALVLDCGDRAWTTDQISVTTGTAAFTGSVIHIDADGAGTGASNLVELTASAAFAGDAINISMANMALGAQALVAASGLLFTSPLIDLDGSAAHIAEMIQVTTAGVGAADVPAGILVSGTGDLAAGADLVRLLSTGNISSTSHILAIEQNTGAGSVGAFGLYINTTGANVEALRVDAGTSTFDETVIVGDGTNNATIDPSASDGVTYAGTVMPTKRVEIRASEFEAGPDGTAAEGTVNNLNCWNLDAGATENVRVMFEGPWDLSDNTAIDVDIICSRGAHANDDAVLRVDYLVGAAGALDTSGALTSGTAATITTAAASVVTQASHANLTLPSGANIASGDYVLLQITRLGADGADTLGVDLAVTGVRLSYSADRA